MHISTQRYQPVYFIWAETRSNARSKKDPSGRKLYSISCHLFHADRKRRLCLLLRLCPRIICWTTLTIWLFAWPFWLFCLNSWVSEFLENAVEGRRRTQGGKMRPRTSNCNEHHILPFLFPSFTMKQRLWELLTSTKIMFKWRELWEPCLFIFLIPLQSRFSTPCTIQTLVVGLNSSLQAQLSGGIGHKSSSLRLKVEERSPGTGGGDVGCLALRGLRLWGDGKVLETADRDGCATSWR